MASWGEIDTLFRKTDEAEEMQATPNRAQIIKPTFSTWVTVVGTQRVQNTDH